MLLTLNPSGADLLGGAICSLTILMMSSGVLSASPFRACLQCFGVLSFHTCVASHPSLMRSCCGRELAKQNNVMLDEKATCSSGLPIYLQDEACSAHQQHVS